jgi:EAL domain-containing protein (putative c-di-GMP-specific phosphodiesterase class I)
VLQPILDVSTGALVAAEALARFPSSDGSPVAQTFALAHAAGRGGDLEAACLHAALDKRHEIPDGVLMSVNVSPDALEHAGVQRALEGDLSGVIVEVTEHPAADPTRLYPLLEKLRRRGALIAVDDASSGYAGLLRLAKLQPDIVKLDRTLVAGVGANIQQTAVIEALVSLSRRLGARLVGEGVECLDDLKVLAELDVDYAQGWAIARPATRLPELAPQAIAACLTARRALLGRDAWPAAGFVAGMHQVTTALAASTLLPDVQEAIASAAASLGVDIIGLSTLADDTHLREVTATGAPVDPNAYALSDFPATRSALLTGALVEAHIDDPHSDTAERALLAAREIASVLIIPLIGWGTPLGILEFSQHSIRRWTGHDMKQARALADYITGVLLHLNRADAGGPPLHVAAPAPPAPRRGGGRR